MLKIHKTSNKLRNLSVGVATFCFTFLAAFFASTNFMPVGDGSAAELNVASTATGYYANISSLGTIDISIDATPDGALGVGKDTLTIDTNATSGYKLYIGMVENNVATTGIADADANRLYYTDNGTVQSSTGYYLSPSSGTLSSPVALSNNTWGYATSRTNSSQTATDYSDAEKTDTIFAGVPLYGNEDMFYANNSPTTASTNTVDVYYGVNATTALPSGTYTGTVSYTAITDGPINDSDYVSVLPASQTGLAAGNTITVSTGLYPGSDANNIGNIVVQIGENTCTNPTPAISASGNLTITCTAPAQSSYANYPVTVEITKYGKVYTADNAYEYVRPTDGYMHEFNCNSLTNTGDTAKLEDIRDGNTYLVAKLADGNCWMVEDLKLGGDADMDLTDTYSDVSPSGFTLKAENTGTWCTTNSAECDDQSMMIKTGVPNGYLYNWYAATAGSGKYSTTSGSVSSSICPKGWTLPTGGPSSQFVTLSTSYGGPSTNQGSQQTAIANLMASPIPGFNYAGYRNGGSTNNTTTYGGYWSRTARNSDFAYYLVFDSSGRLNPQYYNYKWYGFAIRCIAKTPSTIVNMQDMSATICDNLAVGNILTLTDTRDQSTYAVKKLVARFVQETGVCQKAVVMSRRMTFLFSISLMAVPVKIGQAQILILLSPVLIRLVITPASPLVATATVAVPSTRASPATTGLLQRARRTTLTT